MIGLIIIIAALLLSLTETLFAMGGDNEDGKKYVMPYKQVLIFMGLHLILGVGAVAFLLTEGSAMGDFYLAMPLLDTSIFGTVVTWIFIVIFALQLTISLIINLVTMFLQKKQTEGEWMRSLNEKWDVTDEEEMKKLEKKVADEHTNEALQHPYIITFFTFLSSIIGMLVLYSIGLHTMNEFFPEMSIAVQLACLAFAFSVVHITPGKFFDKLKNNLILGIVVIACGSLLPGLILLIMAMVLTLNLFKISKAAMDAERVFLKKYQNGELAKQDTES